MEVINDNFFLHLPQKLLFKLNEKDQQTFELEFTILSMKGVVEHKIIKIYKLSSSIDVQLVAVANYIKKIIIVITLWKKCLKWQYMHDDVMVLNCSSEYSNSTCTTEIRKL